MSAGQRGRLVHNEQFAPFYGSIAFEHAPNLHAGSGQAEMRKDRRLRCSLFPSLPLWPSWCFLCPSQNISNSLKGRVVTENGVSPGSYFSKGATAGAITMYVCMGSQLVGFGICFLERQIRRAALLVFPKLLPWSSYSSASTFFNLSTTSFGSRRPFPGSRLYSSTTILS